MESIWKQSERRNHFDSLEKNIKTDVLVIGGGMAEVLCAFQLQWAGVPCVLVETKTLGSGITGNTTAKISSQHGLFYQELLRRLGREQAKLYWQANEQALAQYRNLCREIDCDLEEKISFVCSRSDREAIRREAQALKQMGVPVQFTEQLPLPFPVCGAVGYSKQAQFHPMKFLDAISRELTVYEHTMVRELKGTTAITNRGKITAQKIIVATHFPFINTHGSYFLKMYQYRSYVIALKGAQDVNGIYIDEDKNGVSLRNYGELLLIGGGGHRTGKQGGNWQQLREFARQYYPGAVETTHWATQDCMTLDGMPYIGQYSAATPNVYVATGFNKWGMTTSMVAATLLTDLIQGKNNPFVELFSPSRGILQPQLARNAWEAAIGFLTPTLRRCPHLGCALKWNPQEHSWDCSCHGSRFTETGQLIDNPAAGDWKRK